MSSTQSPTTKRGDRFRSTVTSLSAEGHGVVRSPEGQVYFVEASWPGDEADFEVLSFEGRFGRARIAEMVKASPDRVEAPCPHQGWSEGKCGGCPWMGATYESQLKQKEHRAIYALTRPGLIDEQTKVLPILGSKEIWGYRNRAQFKTDGERFGFVSQNSRVIAELDDCLVLNEPMRAHLKNLKSQLPRKDWSPGGEYMWSFIEVDDASELNKEPALNTKRPFRQGNTAQNEVMRGWLKERMSKMDLKAPLLELYCGGGNFTEVAAEAGFKKILAVEVSQSSLDQLRAKLLTSFKNMKVQVYPQDLRHPESFTKVAHHFPDAGVLLLDPPREGAKGIGHLVSKLPKLQEIFYVSCDSATFTRDAGELKRQGFRLAELQCLDLFPHTPHVEMMSRFVRV